MLVVGLQKKYPLVWFTLQNNFHRSWITNSFFFVFPHRFNVKEEEELKRLAILEFTD